MIQFEEQYRSEIAKILGTTGDSVFFFWKGRVALYALLKAMDVGAGDEVIVQGYTCVVVANAILYLGATPIYADIDKDTYNFNIESLKSKITEKTKVIICQNTYGLSSNLEMIESFAKEMSEKYGHPVYSLEDCTHGFGGTYHGKPNGCSCDASFFSTQWSKPYTTGIGGFCAVHNDIIRDRMTELESDKIKPSFVEKNELKVMYFARQYIINDLTYWPMIRLFRWLSRHNLVTGSSSGEEVAGIEMPKDFFKAQSSVQFKKGLKSLKKLAEANALRKKNAEVYTRFLSSVGKNCVAKNLFDDHIFIRYPLLVNNREAFKKKAEDARIILGEWFEGPIYPAYDDLGVWKVKADEIPNAMYVCERIVNLPTDVKNPEKVVCFLKENIDYIV